MLRNKFIVKNKKKTKEKIFFLQKLLILLFVFFEGENIA